MILLHIHLHLPAACVLGCRVHCNQRKTLMGTHGYLSYYLGPAFDPYRCHSLFIISSKSSRVTDTTYFFAKPFFLPGSSPVEQIHALVTDMGTILTEIAKTKVDPTHRTLFIDKSPLVIDQLKEMLLLFQPEPIISSPEINNQHQLFSATTFEYSILSLKPCPRTEGVYCPRTEGVCHPRGKGSIPDP